MQLANLYVGVGEYTAAASLYKEAGRAGSKDALFHLGDLYWRGAGVEQSARTAFALWRSSDFTSKHAELRGARGLAFGVARTIVEFRAFLLFAAGLVAIVSTGGNPMDIVRGAVGGGGGAEAAAPDWDGDDDDDLFGDDGVDE